MSPAGRGEQGASRAGWMPAGRLRCCVWCDAWKGTPPGQELPPPCLPPEIKGFMSAVDVLLWLSPGSAAGAGLFAAARTSLSPVTHGLAECRLSLRECDKREARWWHWNHHTRQAGACAVWLKMTVEMFLGGSARRLWAALAPTEFL